MQLSHLNGLPVVTVQSAEELGTVDGAEFDPSQQQILSLRVNMKGLFSGHKFVPWSGLNAVGENAVTVPNADALASDATGGTDLNGVVGNRVVTASGQDVGSVGDVDFDAASGKLQDLVLKGGMLDHLQHRQDVIPIAWVQSFGQHLIVVNDAAAGSS